MAQSPLNSTPVLALLLVIAADPVHGAALLEDQSASWAAAGLEMQLASGRESALPEALLAAVAEMAPTLSKESAEPERERYKFGKRNTWWFPLRDSQGARQPARSALEMAIHHLYDLVFGASRTEIVGAEWWFQEQGPAEGIGYHYDKDEAYASEHMTMRFPEVSTVTYLTDVGAPTIVLNQTTPDGNLEVPLLPQEGILVHPQRNKHLVFRGNLNHGVSGELSRWAPGGEMHAQLSDASRQPGEMRRRTLLINWWRAQPMPPNTVPFDTERWQRVQLALSDAAQPKLLATADTRDAPPLLAWSAMWPAPPDKAERRTLQKVAIELPPTELYHFSFPPMGKLQPGNYLLQWSRGMAMGPITRLDLHHERSLNALFRDKRPKLFLVFESKGGDQMRWTDRSVPGWVLAFQEQFGRAVKFVLAEPSATPDFMNQFGLKTSDAPTMAIHDTRQGDHKFRMREPLSKAAAWAFVKDFLGGRLPKDELR
jgi:hypothetical protein